MTNSTNPITKQDFLSYFKYPKQFWFLLPEDVESFFIDEDLSEDIDSLPFQDHMKLLRDIVESPKSLALENAFRLNKIKNEKIINFYRTFFRLPDLAIYDHSSEQADLTQHIKSILLDDKISTAFFYKPTLISQDLKIKPTSIYKYRGKIYLIEHFWSTTLKQEAIAHLSFYNHFFTKYLDLKIDQYLITYLSHKPSPNGELIVEITNCLPFTSKVRRPEGLDDEKMKNVNTFFGLEMDYKGTLYEELFERDMFVCINNEPWEIYDDAILNPEKALSELRSFLSNSNREFDFNSVSTDFLHRKLNIVGPSTAHYKMIFHHLLPTFTFSSSVIPLVNALILLMGCRSLEQRNKFLEFTSKFAFLMNFPKDQDYIIFPEAISTYEELRRKRIKVYYDFETVSLPFPYLENTKPYLQIVLQLSLIKTVDNVEQKPTTNLILDPLQLSIDSFKQIIDAIYVDDIDVAYIVYNKSFENTRLKEMAELINEDEYREKVVEIIDRTIDLANWFTYGNSPRIIHRKLQGFHSIKKVNKMIPKHIEEATGTKQYSDLKKCQNGVMAQAMLVSRALVTDPEQDRHNWERNKEFMYSYCENDVRSMMAVELYIDKLIGENKYPPFDPEKFKEQKLKFKRLKAFSR